MWLIPLKNFALLFEISVMEMLMKCSTISRTLTLVAFVGMPPDALLYFLSSNGTCSIEPVKSFRKQIIISRLGIIVSKQMFHPLIQRSNVLEVFRCSTQRRTHCSSKNASKPSRTCTGTTTTQIRRLQCTYFRNCRRLYKPTSYGLSTTYCS